MAAKRKQFKMSAISIAVALLLSHPALAAAPAEPALPPPPTSAPSAKAAKPSEDPAMAPPVLPTAGGLPGEGAKAGATGVFAGFLDPFDYDPRGRRDPFAQPVADVPVTPGAVHGPLLPLQKFDVSQLRVVGILWNVKSPKAMIKDPDGKMHIVGPYTKVGPRNGYIASIREGEIVVVETIEQEGRLVSTAQVVKIAK